MAHLLILQNSPNGKAGERLAARFSELGHRITSCRCRQGQFPQDLGPYQGIVISGGPNSAYDDEPFIQEESRLLMKAADRGMPMFGICLGSQLLASVLCGPRVVFRRTSCEVGYKILKPTDDMTFDPIRPDDYGAISMFIWHNDEVRSDHPDIKVLASSDLCPNHIWRYSDLPIWGVQGHPEITRNDALEWFEECRPVLERDGADIDKLKRDSHDASTAKSLMARFAKLCDET
jgi:GMP synthase (glutamine-hydrolysing)